MLFSVWISEELLVELYIFELMSLSLLLLSAYFVILSPYQFSNFSLNFWDELLLLTLFTIKIIFSSLAGGHNSQNVDEDSQTANCK